MFSNKSYFYILCVVRFTPVSLLFLYSPVCTLQWVPGPFQSHTFISKHTFDFFPSLPDDARYFICPFWHFSCSVTLRTHMTKPFVTGKRSVSYFPGFYSSVLFWCFSAVEGSGHFLRHRGAFLNIFLYFTFAYIWYSIIFFFKVYFPVCLIPLIAGSLWMILLVFDVRFYRQSICHEG